MLGKGCGVGESGCLRMTFGFGEDFVEESAHVRFEDRDIFESLSCFLSQVRKLSRFSLGLGWRLGFWMT
jgi:hypothetical protein